jgi:hypothetical protein
MTFPFHETVDNPAILVSLIEFRLHLAAEGTPIPGHPSPPGPKHQQSVCNKQSNTQAVCGRLPPEGDLGSADPLSNVP